MKSPAPRTRRSAEVNLTPGARCSLILCVQANLHTEDRRYRCPAETSEPSKSPGGQRHAALSLERLLFFSIHGPASSRGPAITSAPKPELFLLLEGMFKPRRLGTRGSAACYTSTGLPTHHGSRLVAHSHGAALLLRKLPRAPWDRNVSPGW